MTWIAIALVALVVFLALLTRNGNDAFFANVPDPHPTSADDASRARPESVPAEQLDEPGRTSWFRREPTHEKQLTSAATIYENVSAKLGGTHPDQSAPTVLQLGLPDSHLRLAIFSLSVVQLACARHMTNPDAILNEMLHAIMHRIMENPSHFLGGSVEPQAAVNRAASYLEDYLHRWSSYVDIVEGGNKSAASGIVLGMLRSIESSEPPTGETAPRLEPLAYWIEGNLSIISGAFVDLLR